MAGNLCVSLNHKILGKCVLVLKNSSAEISCHEFSKLYEFLVVVLGKKKQEWREIEISGVRLREEERDRETNPRPN